MDSILLPIVRSSRLPEYIEELNKFWAEEAVAREKFLEWLTPEVKAEFINGEVIVHSPVRFHHSDAQLLIARLLSVHVDSQNLGKVQGEKVLVRLARNDYEPDVSFWTNKKSFHFDPSQMVFPPPDLVVEILSPSTEQYDRGQKFDDYAKAGVQEYWIVDPAARVVEQYALGRDAYQRLATLTTKDTITSVIVERFAVSVLALFDASENLREIVKHAKI